MEEVEISGKIEAIAREPRTLPNGSKTRGLKIAGEWHNVSEDIYQGQHPSVGDQVTIYDSGVFTIEKKSENQQTTKKSFQEVLEEARPNIQSIETELVQIDPVKKFAIVKARITTPDKEVFEAYGDANPENVNQYVKEHYIRLAETRAIARALRWLLAEGTVEEEVV